MTDGWRSGAAARLRGWFIASVLALSLGLAGCEFDSEPGGPPPIILLMVDTLRADYLGAYGFDGDVSPNLDRFASESVVFRKCFSQAPWTKPSIASLFTSLHVPVHGLRSHGGRFGRSASSERKPRRPATDTLDEDVTTLAEALRAAGYATGAFIVNPWIRAAHGFGQGFDVFKTEGAGNAVTAERPFAAARKWMEDLKESQAFFLYIHLMDVHGPYNAPEEDYDAVRRSRSLGDEQKLGKKQLAQMPPYLRRSAWFPRESGSTREIRARYAAGIRAFDRRLADFLDGLRADGTLDEAIVILTSDHGEQLYEHRNWDHGNSLYDEELHVPLIIRLPGSRRTAAQVNRIVSLIDLMPTVLALVGVPEVDGLQGEDLHALLDGGAVGRDHAETFATAVKWKPSLYSARTETYKLIKDTERSDAGGELYDLQRDPAETKAVGEPPALKAMEDALKGFFAANERRERLEPGSAEIAPDVQERLRALGYDEDVSAE
jgi:arylsulfatase A-like enzyme